MNNLILTASLSAALLGGTALTQRPSSTLASPQAPNPPANNSGRALSRVFSAPPSQSDARVNQDVWRERMAATDLSQREQHYDQMVAAARRDPQLRKALEDWANDAGDPNLAWTARLALRELEANPFRGFGLNADPNSPLSFDLDFGQPFDAQHMLDELRERWNDLGGFQPFGNQGPLGNQGPSNSGQPQANSSVESFSLSVGPDGVTCEIKRNVDGKEETQELKAESVEQLLEAHPELRDKLHVGGFQMGSAGDWFNGFPRGWQLFDNGRGDASVLSPFGAQAGVRTDILGVVVQPLTEQETKDAGVQSGVGLRIDRVESGTIAASMGLQRGQVLIELNGTPIKSRDDITNELKKRGADGSLEAVAIDRWGERRTHTWKPDTSRQL